uniref:BY PROTMAP: gi/814541766/emb/CEQ40992.1/ SPOSA6832_02659 [Sporidiobolus salmonicolor] n=1 Tax=Rhodotorula toruloides TaxID=5286 RepID=A0A0K3CLF1_RHOTO
MSARDDQLESHVATFDPGLKLFVAIAAKISTLHALAGRYTQHLTLEDLSPPSTPPAESPSPSGSSTPSSSSQRTPPHGPKPWDTLLAQRQLDAEQERVKVLMKATIAQSVHWLTLVCAHFEVEMAQLPEEPGEGTRLETVLDDGPAHVGEKVEKEEEGEEERRRRREKLEWEVVWELVLVSLGLVSAGQQAEEPDQKKKSGGVNAAAAKVGGLFSSSSSKETPAKPDDKGALPPLNYTALSRSLVICTADILGIPSQTVQDVEHTIAQFLYFQLQAANEEDKKAGEKKGDVEWDEAAKEYREKAARKNSTLKWAATGAGFILGGVAIGLTGGGLAGYRTHRRMKGLEDVRFEPIKDEDAHEMPQIPSLTATIVASGFLLDLKDSVDPWRPYVKSSRVDAYALKADPQTFLEAGRSLDKFVKNKLVTMGGIEVIKRTALAAVYAGVALPLTVFNSATTAFDSDFTRCREKAKKAGVLLAEILEKEVQGKRPVVLIGYGPGASLIFSCLLHLHELQLGHLVYSAILISLPEAPSPVKWASARSVVAHELVNVWSGNDFVLGIAARLYTLSTRIAGLRPARVEGITDIDASDLLTAGHLDLRHKLPQILERVTSKRDEQPAPAPPEKEMEGLSVVEKKARAREDVSARADAVEGEGTQEAKEQAEKLKAQVEEKAGEADGGGKA